MRKSGENMRIRVHRFLRLTEAEGPGERSVLWVQGCPIRCPGCFNIEAWDFGGGTVQTVGDLFAEIVAQEGREGVTFAGGEPFAQAAALAALGRFCQNAGLSVVTFTGYEWRRIQETRRPDWRALVNVTDLLLAGRFIKEQEDFSRPWVGSRNQEFVFLSDRYRHLSTRLETIPNRLEFRFDEEGQISLNGLAPESEINEICEELASLGLQISRQGGNGQWQR